MSFCRLRRFGHLVFLHCLQGSNHSCRQCAWLPVPFYCTEQSRIRLLFSGSARLFARTRLHDIKSEYGQYFLFHASLLVFDHDILLSSVIRLHLTHLHPIHDTLSSRNLPVRAYSALAPVCFGGYLHKPLQHLRAQTLCKSALCPCFCPSRPGFSARNERRAVPASALAPGQSFVLK